MHTIYRTTYAQVLKLYRGVDMRSVTITENGYVCHKYICRRVRVFYTMGEYVVYPSCMNDCLAFSQGKKKLKMD